MMGESAGVCQGPAVDFMVKFHDFGKLDDDVMVSSGRDLRCFEFLYLAPLTLTDLASQKSLVGRDSNSIITVTCNSFRELKTKECLRQTLFVKLYAISTQCVMAS